MRYSHVHVPVIEDDGLMSGSLSEFFLFGLGVEVWRGGTEGPSDSPNICINMHRYNLVHCTCILYMYGSTCEYSGNLSHGFNFRSFRNHPSSVKIRKKDSYGIFVWQASKSNPGIISVIQLRALPQK